MYQIKVDKSNKSNVFGKKMGAEFSAPIVSAPIVFITKELLETHS